MAVSFQCRTSQHPNILDNQDKASFITALVLTPVASTLMNFLIADGPAEVFRSVVAPFLTLRNIVDLDSAVTNKKFRKLLSDCVHGLVIQSDIYINLKAAQWLRDRKCLPAALRFVKTTPSVLKLLAAIVHKVQSAEFWGCAALAACDMMEFLQHCGQLTELELTFFPNVEKVVREVARLCPNLQKLDISLCRGITDTDVIDLVNGCHHVRHLDIMSSLLISDRAVCAVARGCRQLQCLRIHCGDSISDSAVIELAQHCKYIQALTLRNGKILSDGSVVAVAENCAYLSELDVFGCDTISDVSVLALARHCPRLCIICLGCCFTITDESVMALARACPLLTDIDLTICFNITDVAVVEVAKRCRQLERIGLMSCHLITAVSLLALLQHCEKLRTVEVLEKEAQFSCPECQAVLQKIRSNRIQLW